MNVLVIGRNPEVMEQTKAGLSEQGITADGTTDIEKASVDFNAFNAKDFGLVAFGGGVDMPVREKLKSEFRGGAILRPCEPCVWL